MRSLLTILVAFFLIFVMACDNSSTREDTAPSETQGEPSEEGAEETEVRSGEVDETALRDPSLATAQAPDQYQVLFETTKGNFTVQINREWAPNGADRFYNLVKIGFYNDVAFFRVVEDFMVQFGIHGDPAVASEWMNASIPDDQATRSNKRGKITFATRGPNTRTTQVFINFTDNAFLDTQGFSPFGEVVDGMDVVDSLYSGYGEGAPRGRGPDQGRIQSQGNEYLRGNFERLDYTTNVSIVE